MQMRIVICSVALVLISALGAAPSASAAGDPMEGTWKLNLAKSKYNPGPAPKSSIVKISIENDTETYSAENVDATGTSSHGAFTVKLDGSEAPVSGLSYADTISIKRISPNHTVATLKKDGKVAMTVDVKVAVDGKSRTLIYSGKNAAGKAEHDIVVFDKEM
jgi:hypothetical protein